MNLAKHWRQKSAYYRLEGQRNRVTGVFRFPARPSHPDEQAQDWEPYVFSGRGEIYSFTVLRQAASGFDRATPYPIALVRLEEGPLIMAQLTDCTEEELSIGQPVEMVTRKLKDTGKDGVIVYGYKFRPLLSAQQS